MLKMKVSGLSIYPIKSCRGLTLKSSYVGNFGLEGDRRWMIVDNKGMMITQRKLSKLCLINIEMTKLGLNLKIKNKGILSVIFPLNNKKITVKVWHDECSGLDAGNVAALWLSDFLSIDCRLVYFPDDEFRQVDLDYADVGDKTAFSDGFPLLLVSQGSLDDLNSRLNSTISMERFRPNIVVSGCEAFAEDGWKKIRIGDIVFRIVKPCSRCIIPNINIETAEREVEPIRTLSSYRKINNKIFFGQNMIAESLGEVDIDMKVTIIE